MAEQTVRVSGSFCGREEFLTQSFDRLERYLRRETARGVARFGVTRMETTKMNMTNSVDRFVDWYGDGSDGAAPGADQWSAILNRDPAQPLTLINFFKFNERAHYQGDGQALSGSEAFDLYAAVSIPTMQRIGGRFLLVAPFEATFIGASEEWDLVAIGSYPNLQAFLDLYQDENYRAAFAHRTAACARQKVLLAAA
ncbi:MAG: DUF1330 domain-containing protein [Stappiaceae bacterium]